MNRADLFEVKIPLRLTDVDVFISTVKSIQPSKKTLTIKELIDGMSGQEAWKKITPDGIFMQVLHESPLLKEGSELSKNALMLWGIVLCGGKSKIKVKAFYDVLQDNNQERISAEDKDFPGNFTLMVDLATQLVNTYEARDSGKTPEYSESFMRKLEGIRSKFAEDDFLDPVFGANSNLMRDEWEKKVLESAKWIFDSNKVRATVYARVEKE